MAGGICVSDKRLDGQTVVITGCSVGIGKETARELSRRGAKIVMACRNTKAAEKTADEIRRETGKELLVMELDLASLSSVRNFAKALKTSEKMIHILINNAEKENIRIPIPPSKIFLIKGACQKKIIHMFLG
ncbi:hypothetical protein SK128_016404 [Halocaridina rubra]|uniref:Uncharacterized protein n=1 Tax=Halocaridina rubra TaxID=373956 RepID=A0AAN8XC90_HALRR